MDYYDKGLVCACIWFFILGGIPAFWALKNYAISYITEKQYKPIKMFEYLYDKVDICVTQYILSVIVSSMFMIFLWLPIIIIVIIAILVGLFYGTLFLIKKNYKNYKKNKKEKI